MNPYTEFVCNVSECPDVEAAVKALRDFQKMAEEKVEFLRKQAKSLDEEKKKRWDDIFLAAQKAGKIDAKRKVEDFNMHLHGNDTQFSITDSSKTPKAEGPLSALLASIFS